jgi:hypothetical protein
MLPRHFLFLLAMLLGACGHDPAGAPVPRVTTPTRVVPAAPVSPAVGQPPGAEPDVRARVAAALARLDKVETLVGKVIFDETKQPPGHYEHGEAKFSFRHRPFAARVDVLDSNRWFANGSSLLWNGGTSVKIKAAHVPFSVTFAYDNAQVVSARGYRLDQTDIFSMGKVLRAPGTSLRAVGERRINGEEVYLVDIVSPASLPGITHELIGLNDRILIPTYREMYAGEALVHKGQGLGVVLDQPLQSDVFDL